MDFPGIFFSWTTHPLHAGIWKMHVSVGARLAGAQKFYRISEWIHFLGFVFLGILFGAGSSNPDLYHTLEVLIASSLLLAFAYSFNLLCDSELESSVRLSRKAKLSHHPRELLLSFLPAVLALSLVAWSAETVLLAIIFLLVWTLYSCPGPRLKAIPVLCTVTNGLGFSILFLMGFAAVTHLSPASLMFFCILVLLEIPGQLIHEVTHSNEDTQLGDKTTAVQYGTKRSFEGAVLSLLSAIVLLAAMFSQRIVNTLTGLSAESFAGIFMFVFLSELRTLNESRESLGVARIARFRSLRAMYKYGGIVAGVLLALALLT
jgi:4-hydroxybenzoate polyprenyltransferase